MIEAPKGTRDILPPEIERWHAVERAARDTFARYGFREIRTPIFESTELFARGIGEGTDIVVKEMYTFTDRKGRSLTLRPEATAPVARAFVEHGMQREGGLHRLYYIGPMFRYERPQKGRMRQFHQIGAEVFGSEDPAVDAETLEMLMTFLGALGIENATLSLNSVGDQECRPAYRRALLAYLEPLRDRLCEDCRRRLEDNPLRCFDCKVESDRALMAKAPVLADSLCGPCRAHFDKVVEYVRGFGLAYRLDPRLVRGLDYYRRTSFEVTIAGLGAQNALLGGGRYDGLVRSLGGSDVPGFGFAVGEERLVMTLPEAASAVPRGPDAFIAAVGEAAVGPALLLARSLRATGLGVAFEPQPGRSLKSQLRRAHDLGARRALILGEDEIRQDTVTIKTMADGAQETVPRARVVERLEDAARG